MLRVDLADVFIATTAAFIFSAVYYVVLSKQLTKSRLAKRHHSEHEDSASMTPTMFIVEFVRTFVLALVMAYAVTMLNLLYIEQALLLAFWLWVGFPVVLLVGSVVHEHFPVKLAIIHAGDWLVKLLILAAILTFWR